LQQQKKRHYGFRLRYTFVATTVAVLAITFILLNIHSPDMEIPTNMFNFRIYAMERTDGSFVMQEVYLSDDSQVWGGFVKNDDFFISIGLRIDGINVKTIELYAEYGFFAIQQINFDNNEIINDEHMSLLDANFQIVGNRVAFESAELTDGLLLFLGATLVDNRVLSELSVYAVVTFIDGATQEKIYIRIT